MRKTLLVVAILCSSLGFGARVGLAAPRTISDETPPTTCGNMLVAGVLCAGGYCDNITPICGTDRHEIEDIGWSPFVSEEGEHTASCFVSSQYDHGDSARGDPAFITGFSCRGKYCDQVALECVVLKDAFPASYGGSQCSWTNWVTEPNELRFQPGTGAIAMQCRGGYCDDMRFQVCPIRARQR